MQKKPTYEKNFYRNLGKTLKEERMKQAETHVFKTVFFP